MENIAQPQARHRVFGLQSWKAILASKEAILKILTILTIPTTLHSSSSQSSLSIINQISFLSFYLISKPFYIIYRYKILNILNHKNIKIYNKVKIELITFTL